MLPCDHGQAQVLKCIHLLPKKFGTMSVKNSTAQKQIYIIMQMASYMLNDKSTQHEKTTTFPQGQMTLKNEI